MSHGGNQQIQISYLRISAEEKAFLQHKICFKQCIRNTALPTLDASQTQCVKNCLFKFNIVEKTMIEKMKQIMETYVAGDPNLKRALAQKNKQHKNHK